MKNKLMLPLLAILFAVAGAVATPLVVQSGWIDVDGTGPTPPAFIPITTPSGDAPVCGASGNAVCMVDFYESYSTDTGATASDATKLLKYTQP